MMEVGDGSRLQKRGLKVYLSRSKLEEIFNTYVRQKVEKMYEIHDSSEDTKQVAGFKVGLKKTDISIDVKFEKYGVGCDSENNEVTFTVLDQKVEGTIILHVERAAKFIIDFGKDFINKDYEISFLLNIRTMTVRGSVKPTSEGMPNVSVEIDLPELDLQKDLQYKVENSDLLTDTLNLVKGLWMSELEKEIKASLLPKVGGHFSKVVNEGIRSIYKLEFNHEGEKKNVNLAVNLECEDFEVSNNFVIFTLSGFVNNMHKRRKLYSILHQGYVLPDISRITGEDFAVVQVSDDVIHSAIGAYFLNDISIEREFTEAGCKQMVIQHLPSEPVKSFIGRTDDIYGSELFVIIESRFKISAKHKFFPAVTFGLHIRLRVDDIRVIEKPEQTEHIYVAVCISGIEIIEMFNHDMGPMSDTLKKSKIVSTIKEKASQAKVNHEVEIKKIRIGDCSIFQAVNYTVYDDFIAVIGKLEL